MNSIEEVSQTDTMPEKEIIKYVSMCLCDNFLIMLAKVFVLVLMCLQCK